MNIGPMQLIQLLRGGNPQQVLVDLLQREAGNNPVMNNALSLVQHKDAKGIEILARNIAKEKGIDPDQAVANIRKQLGFRS